jgi:hypothetical protein
MNALLRAVVCSRSVELALQERSAELVRRLHLFVALLLNLPGFSIQRLMAPEDVDAAAVVTATRAAVAAAVKTKTTHSPTKSSHERWMKSGPVRTQRLGGTRTASEPTAHF